MKNLLLPLFASCAVSATAQTAECGLVDAYALGLTSEATEQAAGFEIVSTASVKSYFLNADSYKATTGHMGNYRYVVFGGKDSIRVDVPGSGVTGSTNPSAPGVNPAALWSGTWLAFTAGGTQVNFDIKKDGYLYVVAKLSSNKNYYVVETTTGNKIETGEAVAYTFSAVAPDLAGVLNETGLLSYEVPANADGYYPGAAIIPWPEYIAAKKVSFNSATNVWDYDEASTWADVKKNGLGVIAFPVYKDMTYTVFANGTKITYCGFEFSTEPLSVEAYGPRRTYEDGSVTPEVSMPLLEGGQLPSSSLGAFDVAGVVYKTKSSSSRIVEVAGLSQMPSKGNIMIPSSVSYNNSDWSVTSIAADAFKGSRISSISVPSTVKSIGNRAFANCSSLTSIYFMSNQISSNSSSDIITYTLSTSVYIPKGSIASYRETLGNCLFKEMPEMRTLKCSDLTVEQVNEVDDEMQSIVVSAIPENGYSDLTISVNDVVVYGANTDNKAASVFSVVKVADNKYQIAGAGIADAVITFDFAKGVTTGTRNLAPAEGGAVYYDLNGRRLSAPARGVNVKVSNGKSEKVIVR